MVWTGGCLCGDVQYRAEADPLRAVICHCGMCRRVSGAPFLAFVHFPVEAFTWTKGGPTRYRSSADAERGFCRRCGSTLTMHETVLADRVQVTLGSLDRPQDVRPDDHVWTEEQLPWLRIDDDRPRFPTISTAVPSNALKEET
ncbi:GFA family protein [Rhodospirillaceae bacterium SYSU D60014]|uniref:GFA family protein n=1 Tax=Virgifigura deserti TaxID=2268457 RepID=UPI000E6741F1